MTVVGAEDACTCTTGPDTCDTCIDTSSTVKYLSSGKVFCLPIATNNFSDADAKCQRFDPETKVFAEGEVARNFFARGKLGLEQSSICTSCSDA